MSIPAHVPRHVMWALLRTVADWEETLAPVIRGGLLMTEWFGEAARPLADLDIECFQRELSDAERQALSEPPPHIPDGFYGSWGEFESLVDFGKAMCRYGVNSIAGDSPIQFSPSQDVGDGASLWVYGTPGERFYLDWEMSGDWLTNVAKSLFGAKPNTSQGTLQIDIASAGDYTPDELGVVQQTMQNASGKRFEAPVYSQSTMLAAKLSWLLRGLQRSPAGQAPMWSGAAKDLYDVRLLLDRGDIDSQIFQNALNAFCKSDDIEWSSLQALMSDIPAFAPEEISVDGWTEFVNGHEQLLNTGSDAAPVAGEWMQAIAERLAAHLGAFYVPAEEPWYAEAASAEGLALDKCLVYADWLEERGDSRANFLREFGRGFEDSVSARRALDEIPRLPSGWLQRLCGTSKRCRSVLAELEDVASEGSDDA